jgi:hypothetical protein
MRQWKTSKTVRAAHDDLYESINPDDNTSDTYIAAIIKAVFTSEKERTNKNAMWCQAVLEAIFDEKHLQSKIDVDIVETWTKTLSDTEMVWQTLNYDIVFLKLLMLEILYLGGRQRRRIFQIIAEIACQIR